MKSSGGRPYHPLLLTAVNSLLCFCVYSPNGCRQGTSSGGAAGEPSGGTPAPSPPPPPVAPLPPACSLGSGRGYSPLANVTSGAENVQNGKNESLRPRNFFKRVSLESGVTTVQIRRGVRWSETGRPAALRARTSGSWESRRAVKKHEEVFSAEPSVPHHHPSGFFS